MRLLHTLEANGKKDLIFLDVGPFWFEGVWPQGYVTATAWAEESHRKLRLVLELLLHIPTMAWSIVQLHGEDQSVHRVKR